MAYARAYDEWARNLAATPQLFEVPIIGTAIATVAELAFSHPHVGPATSLALAGGGLYALNNYYAARDRMAIYLAGAQAMRCIAQIANGVTPPMLNAGIAALSSVARGPALAAGVLSASILGDATATAKSIPEVLRDAIDQVNTKVVTDAASKSAKPNPTQIVSDLKSAIKTDQQRQQRLQAAVTAGLLGAQVLSDPNTQSLITFESDIKTCVAKAGP